MPWWRCRLLVCVYVAGAGWAQAWVQVWSAVSYEGFLQCSTCQWMYMQGLEGCALMPL